jgi:hypothetical protein
MGACPSQVFNGVTPAAWDSVKARAAGAGLEMTADSGTLSKSGFTIDWNYDACERSLTVTCTKAPFFLKWETVNAKIKEAIEKQIADAAS